MASEKRKTSVRSEKENCNTYTYSEERKIPTIIVSKSTRNPLAQLSDNVPLPQSSSQGTSKQRRSVLVSKEMVIKKNVRRSESDEKFYLKSEKLTVRSVSNDGNEVNDVFVKGEEHYINYLSDNKEVEYYSKQVLSQERTTVQTVPKNFDVPIKPAKKVTLARKLSRRRKSLRVENFFTEYLYDDEYLWHNYKYMLQIEGNFVFRKSYLEKYVNHNSRLLLINWLIHIHEILNLSEITLFVTIRMIDYFLIVTQVSNIKYELLGITCTWITSKLYETSSIMVPQLVAVCSGAFSKFEIISLEKKILKSINYRINMPDPSTFLYYYLKKEKLANNDKIRYTALFLLEVFTLLLEYSSSRPSLLAASALYLALLNDDMNYDAFLNNIHSHLIDAESFANYTKCMSVYVKQVLKCKCVSQEIVAKYSVQDKLSVAIYFKV